MSGLEVLTIVFITLKLVGVIGWSWWVVLSPTWVPLATYLLIALLAGLVIVVASLGDSLGKRARKRL